MASWSAFSGLRAAARPRCCGSLRGSNADARQRDPGRPRRLDARRRPRATTASSSSRMRCSRISRSTTTSPTASSTGAAAARQIEARVTELLTLVGLPDVGHQVPEPVVGRPAAARRAGPRARDGAVAAAARRAAVGAGCQGARAPARRDPPVAAATGRHHDHGHARPGRGAVDGRSRRGDEPGRHRADRHAARRLRAPGDAVRRRLPRQGERAEGDLLRNRPLPRRAGRTRRATANGFAAGDAVRLYLRPEDRVLSDAGPLDALPNALSRDASGTSISSAPTAWPSVDVDGFDGQRMLV